MAKSFLKKASSFLREVDQLSKLITSKSLASNAQRVWDITGDDIKGALKNIGIGFSGAPRLSATGDDPYAVLNCNSADSDRIIKYWYRLLVRELHPDTGTHPNPERFQKVIEAYNRIIKERAAAVPHA